MDRLSKSPFSLYDFLGYFIPGALFCYLFAIVFDIEEIKWLNIEFFLGLHVFDQSVAFILFSYVFGHAINYLSTLTIEKYSIWSIGYPSKYLFGVKPECYFKKLINKDDENEKESYYISIIWRSGLMIVILPLCVIDFVFGKLCGFRLHYTNSLDATLSGLIQNRIKQFKIHHNYDFGDETGDFFRPIWHYYYEKFGTHAVKLDNYVALYGFTRSISFIFCIYCWLIGLSFFFHFSLLNNLLFPIILSTILTYIFYLAFLKFYRRFTLEGFMCLVIDNDLNKVKEEILKK